MENSKKTKIANERKDTAYSSVFSVVSFFVSLFYLLADLFADGQWLACTAFALLLVLFAVCKISISKIRKAIENQDPKAVKMEESLLKLTTTTGYLSCILLALSLLLAIFVNK